MPYWIDDDEKRRRQSARRMRHFGWFALGFLAALLLMKIIGPQ